MSETAAASYPQRGTHKGYRYQDLIGALLATEILLDESGTLSIETGRFSGDAFDDLVVHAGPRIQVKHAEVADELTASRFMQSSSSLRIDALLPAGTGGGPGALRVVSTWTPPLQVPDWLRHSDVPELLPGIGSSRWSLDAGVIWPEGDEPLWELLKGENRSQFEALCDELVLELGCLPMSGTLADPGEMERLLLARLRDELGVDPHPNNRPADDVAGRLLEITGSARGRRDRTFGHPKLVHETGLRVDRGHIAQAHPLESDHYVRPDRLRTALARAIAANHRVALTGAPGSGKSWALEALARDLRDAGTVVARHYCFLEPGDPDVQARVALESMASNLVFELLSDARLQGLRGGLGAELDDLQTVIDAAHERGEQAVLIVDGLDHVARIPVEGGRTTWSPGDFVAALAALEIPDGVTLVVGSQPGDHLDGLFERGAAALEVPPFDDRMITAQLQRLGVPAALAAAGLQHDTDACDSAVRVQAAANPLYVTFLAREIAGLLGDGELVVMPSQYVNELATVPGDLPDYYAHLLAGDDDLAQVVGEHLAVIEFAVTGAELGEMLPAVGRDRTAQALRRLRPVLTRTAGGGYRVHHESLRRYVLERLAADDPQRVAVLLEPVANWLDALGFFADDRGFRHLLLTMSHAGRGAEALDRIQDDFVARALEHLQPRAAVEANLRLGARIAAGRDDLAALALLAELRRAATTAYTEKLYELDEYAATYTELFGPALLADRLVYEDRPVYGREAGLRLCALVDAAGGSPPWLRYLELPRTDDPSGQDADAERDLLAEWRGAMRLWGRDETLRRLAERVATSDGWTPSLLTGVAQLVVELFGSAALDELVEHFADGAQDIAVPLKLCAAHTAAAAGDAESARSFAREVLDSQVTLAAGDLRVLYEAGGAGADLAARLPALDELADGVLAEQHSADLGAVRRLRAALPILVGVGRDLAPLVARFEGVGWYRRWLRFLVALAEATTSRAVVVALEDAAADTSPFVGEPRACDLYAIHSETEASFAEAFDRLAEDDVAAGLDAMLEIAAGTTTSMQRSPGGPLTIWAILRIVGDRPDVVPVDFLEPEVASSRRNEYYDYHAEAALRMARLYCRRDDPLLARQQWAQGAHYLAGYGMRKDITLFGMLHALDALAPSRPHEVLVRLLLIRRLCDYAVYHSDGAETKHLPVAWMSSLARAAPAHAAMSVALTLREHEPTMYWMFDEGLEHAAKVAHGQVPPLVEHLLWRCVPATRLRRPARRGQIPPARRPGARRRGIRRDGRGAGRRRRGSLAGAGRGGAGVRA